MQIKTPEEIEIMAEGGRWLAEVLEKLREETKIGVQTDSLDELALQLIRERGAKPAFLGYAPHGSKKAYSKTLCVSVNDTVVHGLPSAYIIRDGDVVKLDLGLIHKGLYLDAAITVGVGGISEEAKRLIHATQKALEAGIAEARPGKTLGDIGAAIQKIAERGGFGIVTTLGGHGIGRALHEEPHVANVGRAGHGEECVAGMVLAIEPMITAGSGKVKQLKDDSFVTADGSLAAHFEHTVAITEQGSRVLTKI
jgi:methionyl aminopeptidase